MTEQDKTILTQIANTIRGLSIDAIAAANSGHPGLPLGCAELGAYLYAKHLRYHPQQPNWINRDRFILSAGHGSMLLYSCLHLAGYDVSLENLKNFRQLHSPTAGHPELGELPGIETTTGPLGQGVAAGIGMALAHKHLAAKFKQLPLNDSKVYILAGDGCIMEGISSEASAFAGHLNLNNVVVIYDSNDICLDGPTTECHTEDVQKRYEAYGWDVQTINGHDFDDIEKGLNTAKTNTKPTLIIAKTTIGQGSPSFAGTSDVHGKPLTAEEIEKTKANLGIEQAAFHVPEDVKAYFEAHNAELSSLTMEWIDTLNILRTEDKAVYQEWEAINKKALPANIDEILQNSSTKPGAATRALSNGVLQTIAENIPFVVGGSADLSCSDSTLMKTVGIITKDDFSGRNIKYGVREFGMAAIAYGMAIHGTITPYIGTFFTFSDYMKNAIRLAALMNLNVIYQFTHDSILLGEDGPTHQPVEHLAALRSMPNLTVIRPADATEVKAAWKTALSSENPVALVLSRQGVPDLDNSSYEKAQKGGYILQKETGSTIDINILSTGAEVSLALEVADTLTKSGKSVRVVSLPSFELFNAQPQSYQDEVLGTTVGKYCVIEAQTRFGWHQYVGKDATFVTVDTFGLSAPASDLKEVYGFTAEAIVKKLSA